RLKETTSMPISFSALPTDAQNLTVNGAIVGTLQYMAPEQLEGKEVDSRTDIFALGTVIYEMITGQKAFAGKSQVSLMAAILEHEPPSMISFSQVTPPALDRVVRICLAKNPDDRWQTAREVLRELKWSLESESSPVQEAGQPSLLRAWLPWVIAAAVVFAAAILVASIWRRTKPEEAL